MNAHNYSKLFYLAESAKPFAKSWTIRPVGGLYLSHGPDLPATDVIFDGTKAVLLGWPIHLEEGKSYTVESLADIGGRWVVITEHYVIPDPLASYSVVFSQQLNVVAASPVLIPRDRLSPDHDLNSALGLPSVDMWYPFGLTPWSNVKRLLPEHVLDLDTFTVTRPRRQETRQSEEVALKKVVSNLRQTLDQLQAVKPVSILTTAGRDSRMILAAAKKENLDLITFRGDKSAKDVRVAKQLASMLNVPHSIISIRDDNGPNHTWFEIVGRSVAGASLRSSSTKLSLSPSKVYLKGIGGEVGRRTNYYRPSDEARPSLTPEELVLRFRFPLHGSILEAADEWLTSCPSYQTAGELIEIAYRENRVGGWASPQLHGDSINALWLFPLNQQSTIDSLRFLSTETKTAGTSAASIINMLNPEFRSIPINPVSTSDKFLRYGKSLYRRVFS